jgi:Zn-dependent protease with chaperone function
MFVPENSFVDDGIGKFKATSMGGAFVRENYPRLITIAVYTVVGAMIHGRIGLVLGFIVGMALVIAAGAAAGNYPLDLHEGKVLDSLRGREAYQVVEVLCRELGIDPVPVYETGLDEAQVSVCATGYGRHVRGRIGLSRGLLRMASSEHLQTLITLAVARIWCGEATVMSMACSLAGMPMQLAQARGINGSPRSRWRDRSCGLSPLGKMLLIVLSPFSRLVLSLAEVAGGVLRSDQAALRIKGGIASPAEAAEALNWLSEHRAKTAIDPVGRYNPAEAALYLVSPFESDFSNERNASEIPTWQRSRFIVTSIVPRLEFRLRRLQPEPAPKPEDATPEVPAETSLPTR